MPPKTLNSTEQEALEGWFVYRGLPNLIDDYHASTDVFTRAAPLLVLLWFLGIVGAFGDRFEGWNQFLAAIGGAVFLLALGGLVNRSRGRRALQLPDRVGKPELLAFVLGPALLTVVLDNGSKAIFITAILLALVQLGVVWFAYGFGLGNIVSWGFRTLMSHLGDVFGLMVRSLPLLLVFTMFLFMNAELWQVADDFTWPLFFASTGGLLAVSVLFIFVRLPKELDNVGRFKDGNEIVSIVNSSRAPITATDTSLTAGPPLTRGDKLNVLILAAFSLGIQILMIMAIVGAFYLAFGLVTVRPATIGQWTTAGSEQVDSILNLKLFGSETPLTRELVKVSGFLMAFTALQFTVSTLTDETYRTEFFEDLTAEIRESLAVRIHYLDQLPKKPLAESG